MLFLLSNVISLLVEIAPNLRTVILGEVFEVRAARTELPEQVRTWQ